jgi:hypothetical protein
MLAWIQDLSAIDARATDRGDRRRLSAAESRAVTEKMKTWMRDTTALKTTSLGGAIRYTLGIWSRLTLFLDDAAIWLDNNRTERGLRGPVIGRRNHFGSKSARGRRDHVQPRRVRQGRLPPTRRLQVRGVTPACPRSGPASGRATARRYGPSPRWWTPPPAISSWRCARPWIANVHRWTSGGRSPIDDSARGLQSCVSGRARPLMGTVNMNVEPRSRSLSTDTRPPWAIAMALTKLSPRPRPRVARLGSIR